MKKNLVVLMGIISLVSLSFGAEETIGKQVQLMKTFTADSEYLIVPVKAGGEDKSKLTIAIGDQTFGPYDLPCATTVDEVDFYGRFPLSGFQGSKVEIRAEGVNEDVFELIRQNDHVPGEDAFYKQEYRPQFHFTAKTGWLNDPNGLIYHNGLYHMYFQYNPFDVHWGNMTWGHAVSEDLVHWEEKPAVIFPNEDGICFSGATFIDRWDQLDLQRENEDVIVAFYLRTGTGLSYAYSNDGGFTFSEYEGNPVLTHGGARIDTPRPFWHEGTQRWLAPTYDFFTNEAGEKRRCVGFYSSEDLKKWQFESRVEQDGWGDELCGCVDFFQLPVDGDPKNRKWVMIMIDGSYIIGDFDGKTFHNLEGEPATTEDRIESLVIDQNFYATMTWHNMPNDRRVQITWMMERGLHYPGTSYGQQMSLPSELTLHSSEKGPQLRMNPIQELERLRIKTHAFENLTLNETAIPLSKIDGDLFELEIEFEPTEGSETILDMRGIEVRYEADTQRLVCDEAIAQIIPQNGAIRLKILQDRTSIEIYANDGEVYVPIIKAADPANRSVGASSVGGDVVVRTLMVHELKSIWSGR